MPNAVALVVGLKAVDPMAYGGWDGQNGCWGCELDADNMARILKPLGYRIQMLKTQEATADRILDSLRSAAVQLEPDDIFVFTFAGHGGQQPDQNGDERDGHDETLVAYDREIIDDELNEIWPSFKEGVRILMISDSCNSGTNYRLAGNFTMTTPVQPLPTRRSQEMKAQLVHFGGCRDGSSSAGYLGGGAFTMALCTAWDNGAFRGSYEDFHRAILGGMDAYQQPQYNEYGPVTSAFRNQKPFTTAATRKSGIHCILDIPSGDLDKAREIIKNEAAACLLSAFENALAHRAGRSAASCTASSTGNLRCSGTVTVTF